MIGEEHREIAVVGNRQHTHHHERQRADDHGARPRSDDSARTLSRICRRRRGVELEILQRLGEIAAGLALHRQGHDQEFHLRHADPLGGVEQRALDRLAEPDRVAELAEFEADRVRQQAPDGTPLGRPPGSGRKAADLYAELLAAEPHATAERKRELRTEADRQARQSPLFFDLTLSLSKSISIFHASLGENARLARQAGDKDGDEYWSGLVAEVDEMIWQAVHAGFGYFQREAGYTRTGSHNTRVHGRETGQWHEADLAVAHWLQHTSRDGDMQLHVHSQIAHVARTGTDGKWRAPDSLGYNEHVGAVAAIVSQHLEEALTRRFGVEWVARDDGHGFEIKGI